MMSISQNEQERAIFRSRRKFQTDLQSDLATAEDNGERKGRMAEKVEIARKMLKRNRPIVEIAEDTGLTCEEVENLRKEI